MPEDGRTKRSYHLVSNLTRVISANALAELRAGYNHFDWANLLAVPEIAGTPNYVFSGLIIGGPRNFPQEFRQNQLSARYDLSLHSGSHDFKIGGEFIGWHDTGEWRLLSRGAFTFASNPPDLAARLPASAWNGPRRETVCPKGGGRGAGVRDDRSRSHKGIFSQPSPALIPSILPV